MPVVPPSGGDLLPHVPDLPSVPASPRTGGLGGPGGIGLETFKKNLEGKAKFTKVTTREDTVGELEDDEGHIVAKLYRSQVVRRGAEESMVVTCLFWAAVP